MLLADTTSPWPRLPSSFSRFVGTSNDGEGLGSSVQPGQRSPSGRGRDLDLARLAATDPRPRFLDFVLLHPLCPPEDACRLVQVSHAHLVPHPLRHRVELALVQRQLARRQRPPGRPPSRAQETLVGSLHHVGAGQGCGRKSGRAGAACDVGSSSPRAPRRSRRDLGHPLHPFLPLSECRRVVGLASSTDFDAPGHGAPETLVRGHALVSFAPRPGVDRAVWYRRR